MNLTQEQTEAADFIIDSVEQGKKVIGFIAPGGCGKTFTLKHISKKLSDATFTATTNKASSVMKSEGIKNSKTLHSAISKHVPTDMFLSLAGCYEANRVGKTVSVPESVSLFLEEIKCPEEKMFEFKNEKELIAEYKIDPFDDRIFSHYATCEYKGGSVFIDEASMLPSKSQYNNEGKMKTIGLDAVKRVFDTVVLVGDDSQLPPINGKSSFDEIEKVVLTENHRSDKSLLRLLEYAREGKDLTHFEPMEGENVRVVPLLDKNFFDREQLVKNKVAHIVYKNATRKSITKMIRDGLSSDPVEGEPIVYKGANIDEPEDKISKNETGVFNGIIGEWENHKQSVNGRNFDEYGSGFTYLQYGYAITAHTAQGSSFDYVIVHVDDIPRFIDKETRRKWIYTAVSRARKGIVIVF